jgi:hypothetical protein
MGENPREYYWGHSAYFHDPDGNLVELTEEYLKDGRLFHSGKPPFIEFKVSGKINTSYSDI